MPELKNSHDSLLFSKRLIRSPLPVSALFFVAALLGVVGCAKIGAPLPPEILIPKAAVDLTARQRADSVILKVSLPKQNTNGTAVTTLKSIEVYRLAEDAGRTKVTEQLPDNQFRRKADPFLSIPAASMSKYATSDLLSLEDSFSDLEPSVKYSQVFRYAVLFVNKKNQAAGFSNQTVIAPVAIPRPPEEITIDVADASINLRWAAPLENMDGSKPARISGYNIYRSTDPEMPDATPINPRPLQKPEFKDLDFQFDSTYYYRVRVIGSIRNPMAASGLSKSVEVTPVDVFPPLPAESFNAVFENNIILLLWNPSASPDIAGYKISRWEIGTTKEQLLPEGLITAHSYRDKNMSSDRKYTYSIIAIDTHGNESSPVEVEAATR